MYNIVWDTDDDVFEVVVKLVVLLLFVTFLLLFVELDEVLLVVV